MQGFNVVGLTSANSFAFVNAQSVCYHRVVKYNDIASSLNTLTGSTVCGKFNGLHTNFIIIHNQT
jgi:hypothetical protein